MKAAYEIRSLRDEDKPSIAALWRRVFDGSTERDAPEQVIARKQLVQPDLFYVAVHGSEVIGTVVAGYDGVRGWVHKLIVDPAYRRQGIATDLMRKAEEGLRVAGCPKLNLQVRGSNTQVVKFYQALGYLVEDRVSLGKPLSS